MKNCYLVVGVLFLLVTSCSKNNIPSPIIQEDKSLIKKYSLKPISSDKVKSIKNFSNFQELENYLKNWKLC